MNAKNEKRKVGRPKGSMNKAEYHSGRLVIACLEREEAEIRRRAKASGKKISRYLVDCALS